MNTKKGVEQIEGVDDMTKRRAAFSINGKPSSLREIRHAAREDSLKHELGDYVAGRETPVPYPTLRKWRDSGKLRAKKIRDTWYYSRQDLLQLLKTESDRDPKSK